MFRRKTDQVYSTLQQVQRRITEQPPSPDDARPHPAAAPASPPVYPFAAALPRATPEPRPLPPPVEAPELVPAERLLPTTERVRRTSMQLSAELATFLVVLWLITVVIAFFIGQAQGRRPDPSVGLAPGAAGGRVVAEAGAATPGRTGDPMPAALANVPAKPGRYVLVLQSVSRTTPEAEQTYAAMAKSLNDTAIKFADRGYRPWFAIRRPANGGLQLVFGCVNGQFGINKDDFADFATEMERGYKGAHWVTLGDGKDGKDGK